MQRALQTHQKALGILRGAVIWGYLGSANRLIGCGGLQHHEFARHPV